MQPSSIYADHIRSRAIRVHQYLLITGPPISIAEMQKVGDTGDISLLFFLAAANFWAILAILGHFWAILCHFFGHFLVLILVGQKCISAFFVTFCISAPS